MKPVYKNEMIEIAKGLRKNATKQENRLWYDFLKDYPVKFQRQRPIKGFVVDFYCAAANLSIEVDGSQHYTEQGKAYDTERAGVLAENGIDEIRFSNKEVDNDFASVCKTIDEEIRKRNIKPLNAKTRKK